MRKQERRARISIRQHTSAYAYVSIHQHTPAYVKYVSIRLGHLGRMLTYLTYAGVKYVSIRLRHLGPALHVWRSIRLRHLGRRSAYGLGISIRLRHLGRHTARIV